DRVASALAAARDGRDILVLDDGFQHRRIGRDLSIVMLDSGSVFGDGYLFPRGILREPVSSLKRADILVLSKIDKMDDKGKNDIIRKLQNSFPGKLIVTARHRPTFLNDVTGAVYSAETLKGQKACLISGIADPGYFVRAVEDLGALPVLRHDYADHHSYNQKDIDRISADCRNSGIDSIVTTKKDYVKMRALDLSAIEERLLVLDIEMDIVEGKEALVDRLNSVISGDRG
ncbi:MAG: tetraacyldisaccharide 4'-kinase, partial [Candidatus Omnitrophota bacterium]